jgi:hypothetical protein
MGDLATSAIATAAAGIWPLPPYMERMPDAERDPTEEWLLPKHRRPPLLGELVERIDEALATARSSESAVMTVGAAALDAAEQARRAAELAERASVAAERARAAPFERLAGGMSRIPLDSRSRSEEPLDRFNRRADRITSRLRELESA